MTLIVSFTVTLRPDTEDPDEARQDALDFVAMAKESWYSPVALVGAIVVEDAAEEE